MITKRLLLFTNKSQVEGKDKENEQKKLLTWPLSHTYIMMFRDMYIVKWASSMILKNNWLCVYVYV